MNTQDKFKMGSWISGHIDTEFHWGHWDCNIFFVAYHDMMYGTKDLDRVVNQYFDKRSGIRLLKNMGLTPNQWLHMKDYSKISENTKKKDGDLAVLDHKLYASVYIYYNGAYWSVQENVGLAGYTPSAIKKAKPTWWRKNG